MESLIFSLNATIPVFLVMVAGYLFKQIGLLNDEFVRVANKFNFKVTLPVMLFLDLCKIDLGTDFDLGFVIFTAIVTAVMIGAIWLFAKLFIKRKEIIGEFIQASYRSSVAVFGIAFMTNIYGHAGIIPMIIIGAVPIYNIMAVIILSVNSPSENLDAGSSMKNSVINILKNPIILGILAGIIVALSGIDFPVIIDKPLESIADLASPLALICIGASFEGRKALNNIKPTIVASVVKLVILPLVFLPIAIKLGYREEALVGLIIFLGTPTTPSSYIMSKNMGYEGTLTTSTVMLTTLLSTLTLTFWIFITKYFGLI